MCICEYCGKEYGTLKSIRSHKPFCKLNPNGKHLSSWNKGLTKESDERVKKGAKTLKTRYDNGEITPSFLGKTHTEEEKKHLSEIRKLYLAEHPEKIPYKINHSSKKSYPETYFEEVFNNDDLLKTFTNQYPVGLYSLDFAFVDKKIDVEVDGEQHYRDTRIVEHDKIRTKILNDLGWTVFRIRWATYKKLNESKKQDILNQIKDLIS